MTDEPAGLRVDVDDGPPVVLRPVGEIDIATSETFAAAAERVLPASTDGPVVVDLAGVAFMDSSGLAVLVHLAERAPVIVRNPSVVVRRVIERTGLADVLRLEP